MTSKKSVLVVSLIILLVAVGTADAAGNFLGRLIGKVVDPDGNPIEGVTVRATCEEDPDFDVLEVTDKKGVFKLDFDVIDVVYTYVFSKPGFMTMKTEQTWRKDGTERFTFTLTPGESGTIGDTPVLTSNEAAEAYQQAVDAFQASDYATAEIRFKEALEYDPELRQAWEALSVVELSLENYQEATAAAEKAIEMGATDPAIFRTRWEAYRLMGDEAKTAEAQADFERFGQLAEEAKRIYNEGVAALKAGDKEQALVLFQQSLDADPNLEPALFAVATTALELGKFAESAAASKTILDLDPENEDALRLRYNAALELQDDEMLIDALVGLAPVEPEIANQNLWILAMAAYNANDNEKSKERFGKVIEVDPTKAQAYYLLGLVYLGEGDKVNTRQNLERFLELAPDDPDADAARDILEYLDAT